MDGKLLFLGVVFLILVLAWIGAGVLWRAAEVAELVAPLEIADYDELSVVTVGTGNAFENPERRGPSTAIGLGRTVVLVDAGRGIAEGLRAAQIPVDQPEVVLLTSLLPHNTVGLDDLLMTGWQTKRSEPIRVVGPEGTRQLVEGIESAQAAGRAALADALGLPEAGARVEILEAGDGTTLEVGGLTLEARALPGGPLPTLAWRASDARSKVVVAGNGWGHEVLERFAGGADALVHEAAYLPTVAELEGTGAVVENPERIEKDRGLHTSIEEVGKLASRAQIARLILVRLRPPPFFNLQIQSIVGRDYDGSVVIPDDGDLVYP